MVEQVGDGEGGEKRVLSLVGHTALYNRVTLYLFGYGFWV